MDQPGDQSGSDATRTDSGNPSIPVVRTGPPDDRSRDALVAAGVIVAAAALWAVALGVLDRGPATPTPRSYSASPSARVERRPVLFAIRTHASEGIANDQAIGVAVPIASIEPGGALQAPLQAGATDDARRAIATAFASNYLESGTAIRLLYGGAVAGTLRLSGAADTFNGTPSARVTYDPDSRADVLETAANDLLAISDTRYGAASSGARPMRESHREAVEQLARSAIRERLPGLAVEDVEVTRVRVADLDHIALPELLASMLVTVRLDTHQKRVYAVFVIGEPATGTATDTYRLAYARTAEVNAPTDGFVFVDQADLTASAYDEVVVRGDENGTARYFVLERESTGWTEAVASTPVSAR